MKVELLAPAGNFECLRTAYYFGADAAYIAGAEFGLRAYAANFSLEEIRRAAAFAKKQNKRLYIAVNSVIPENKMEDLTQYLFFLADVGVDAVIFADPAVLKIVRDLNIPLRMHLSTQANTFNAMSAAFWYELGVDRIVLSRELTLRDIREITAKKPDDLELESFVHGAMCVAYSGRCLLSSVTTGRSGNKGECAQPCRWEYYLYEKGYDGQYFKITEDEKGTYVLNSKDMMMIEHIPELIEAGISSFKIEGRMKSVYYVASAVGAYRRAIDAYLQDASDQNLLDGLKEELTKSATRPFSTGFYYGNPGQDILRDEPQRRYSFVGIVLEDAKDGTVLVEQRNKFLLKDALEVLSPHLKDLSLIVDKIINEDGQEQSSAPHPQQIVQIPCDFPLKKGDILRKLI
jgi:putative protease